jgi:signal transduction histidine kinase
MSRALTCDDLWREAYRTLDELSTGRVACFEADVHELLTPVSGAVDPHLDTDLLREIAETSERAWFRASEPGVRLLLDDRVIVADCADAQGLRGALAVVFSHSLDGSASIAQPLAALAASATAALGRIALQATTVPITRHQAELERSRVEMSRALHDGPAQDLAMANMALEQVLKQRAAQTEASPSGDIAVEFLERAIVGLRHFISELRGEQLAQPVAHTPAPTLVSLFPDDPQEQAILAVVREALRNARKHAEADAVSVTVRRDTTGLEVQIADDGRGFSGENVPGHFGLTQMHERASELGGELSIESAPGEGTTVRLATPTTEGFRTARRGAAENKVEDQHDHS